MKRMNISSSPIHHSWSGGEDEHDIVCERRVMWRRLHGESESKIVWIKCREFSFTFVLSYIALWSIFLERKIDIIKLFGIYVFSLYNSEHKFFCNYPSVGLSSQQKVAVQHGNRANGIRDTVDS
jgi:hypothetical protein